MGGEATTGGSEAQRDPQQILAALESSLLNGDISQQTHATISKQLEDPKISQRRLDDPLRPPNTECELRWDGSRDQQERARS